MMVVVMMMVLIGKHKFREKLRLNAILLKHISEHNWAACPFGPLQAKNLQPQKEQ